MGALWLGEYREPIDRAKEEFSKFAIFSLAMYRT